MGVRVNERVYPFPAYDELPVRLRWAFAYAEGDVSRFLKTGVRVQVTTDRSYVRFVLGSIEVGVAAVDRRAPPLPEE